MTAAAHCHGKPAAAAVPTDGARAMPSRLRWRARLPPAPAAFSPRPTRRSGQSPICGPGRAAPVPAGRRVRANPRSLFPPLPAPAVGKVRLPFFAALRLCYREHSKRFQERPSTCLDLLAATERFLCSYVYRAGFLFNRCLLKSVTLN